MERSLRATELVEAKEAETKDHQGHHHQEEVTPTQVTTGLMMDMVVAVDMARRGDRSAGHKSTPKWQ